MADQIFNVNCGFFNSVNEDRLYNAEQMNNPYKRVISNGVFATPAGTPSTDFQVVSASNGMNIICKAGDALCGDKWFNSPSDINIVVPNNTNIVPRFDSVIIQVDDRVSGRVGNVVYRTGLPSSNPQPPELDTTANVYEYRVANIYVAPSANTINNDAITDCRGSSECPWVTSLIYQVDTSVLFSQYQSAYQDYYSQSTAEFEEYEAERTEAWNQFWENLTEDLTISTNVIMLTNDVTTVTQVSNVSIGIPSYNPSTDILQVYINGLRATENVQYSLNSNQTSIDLATPLKAGQSVNFVVFKSIITGDISTAVTMIQSLNAKVANFMADSGWINFILESGATAYNSSMAPAVRCVGNRVYLRGAFKGITATGKTICTLPVSYRPEMDHVFTTSVISGGSISRTVAITVSASDGTIKLTAASGTISSSAMIPLATNFVLAKEAATAGASAALIASDDGNGHVVLEHS